MEAAKVSAFTFGTFGSLMEEMEDERRTPPPPRSEPAAKKPAVKKKAWTKPTVRVLEDGVRVTESSAGPFHSEGHTYHPPS